MMGIPKKLVPSSPVRNTIRRVVREAYRVCSSRDPARIGSLSILVKLLRMPQDPAAAVSDSRGKPLRPFERRPTDRALKRLVRAEVDSLFERVLALPRDGTAPIRGH